MDDTAQVDREIYVEWLFDFNKLYVLLLYAFHVHDKFCTLDDRLPVRFVGVEIVSRDYSVNLAV